MRISGIRILAWIAGALPAQDFIERPSSWDVEDGYLHPSEAMADSSRIAEEDAVAEQRVFHNPGKWRFRGNFRLDSSGRASPDQWKIRGQPVQWLNGHIEGNSAARRAWGSARYADAWGFAEFWGGQWRWNELRAPWTATVHPGLAANVFYRDTHLGIAAARDSAHNPLFALWSGPAKDRLALQIFPNEWRSALRLARGGKTLAIHASARQQTLKASSRDTITPYGDPVIVQTNLSWNQPGASAWQWGARWRRAPYLWMAWARWAQIPDSARLQWRREFRYLTRFSSKRPSAEWLSEIRGLWPSSRHRGAVARVAAFWESPWRPGLTGAAEWRYGTSPRVIGLESGLLWRAECSTMSWTVILPRERKITGTYRWRGSFEKKHRAGSVSATWEWDSRRELRGEMRVDWFLDNKNRSSLRH